MVIIMDNIIWSALPHDIVFTHILSKCDIDTRLALNVKPNKLKIHENIIKKINNISKPITSYDTLNLCHISRVCLKKDDDDQWYIIVHYIFPQKKCHDCYVYIFDYRGVVYDNEFINKKYISK